MEVVTLNDDLLTVPQEIGGVRSEIDVAVAIGRMPRQALSQQLTHHDLYYDFGRRLEIYNGEDFENVPKRDL